MISPIDARDCPLAILFAWRRSVRPIYFQTAVKLETRLATGVSKDFIQKYPGDSPSRCVATLCKDYGKGQ